MCGGECTPASNRRERITQFDGEKQARRVSESQPGLIGRLLAGTARFARRFAWAVVAAALALSGLFGWFTVTHLGMNSDTAGLLSPDLPFRKRSRDFKAAFPHDSDRLAIVLDGANEDTVADGAAKLAAALAREPKVFATVFYPDAHPFFRRNGLLFLGLDELAALAERLAEAQPLLEEVAAAVPDHMPTHRWLAVLYTRQGRTEDAARERATAGRLAQEAESQAFQGVKESMSELLQQSSAGDGESASAEPPPP